MKLSKDVLSVPCLIDLARNNLHRAFPVQLSCSWGETRTGNSELR